MSNYKNHPIYGIGVRGSGKQWHCRGLIFSSEDKVTEIKRLECGEIALATRGKAEAHALELCKTWIDEQSAAVDLATSTLAAGLKGLPPV